MTSKYGSCEPKLTTFEAFVAYDVYLRVILRQYESPYANKTQT